MNEEFLWVEKYRPHTIADTILPDELKTTFQQFVDNKNIPNLILSGTAGVGKTTVARAMLDELDCDYIVINGSMHGNIDTLRNEITSFASTVSFKGGRKYVILDEADYLNANSTQPALRNFMEEFSRNCGFILTCNFRNRIIEPLHSRCSVVDFKINTADTAKLAGQFFKRVVGILKTEGVEHEKAVVAEVIQKHFPDWRRCINELQRYSATGKIDSGILVNLQEENFKQLVGYLRGKNFTDMRKWVAENADTDSSVLFRKLYDAANTHVKPNSIPEFILILADAQYRSAFVADQEINTVSAMVNIMAGVDFQ